MNTPSLLTVCVGVQPEDAGVWVSKGPAKPTTPFLAPLLLQPVTVWDTGLLVDLKTPEDDKHTHAVINFRPGLCMNRIYHYLDH